VCIGTADGYVHLLGPDGSFRWSYSVHGAISQRPVLAGELWLVATSAERIYALTREGTLYWVFRPPSAVASELAADATGTAYFAAADRFLYGVSAHGGVSLRAPFGLPKSGPVVGPSGSIWAENRAGELIEVRGQVLRKVAPESGARVDFGSVDSLRDPDGHELRLRGDGVVELRPRAGALPITLGLTSAPLLGSTWSSFGHYALISARDGLVVALAVVSPKGR
jgi:outer membrane protein assembly factor BamB